MCLMVKGTLEVLDIDEGGLESAQARKLRTVGFRVMLGREMRSAE